MQVFKMAESSDTAFSRLTRLIILFFLPVTNSLSGIFKMAKNFSSQMAPNWTHFQNPLPPQNTK